MSLYEEPFQISKLLLAEEDDERTPEVLLRRILEEWGAETGFVVVREAIKTGEPLYLPNLMEDPRFALLARHRKGEGT